ncbi:glycosyltransferase family 2 protein [Nocardioides zeae]
MPEPTVTVVVPTMFRHDDLDRCLTAIAGLSSTPDRVLVVTRAEDERSRDIATRHSADAVVVPAPGLAVAIETALQHTTTDIVAFIDDDARAHPDWLDRIRAHFAGSPLLGFVAGRDNVHGDAESGSATLLVGSLRRGKLHGKHHLGHGPARPAMHAKGANMALRVAAVGGCRSGAWCWARAPSTATSSSSASAPAAGGTTGCTTRRSRWTTIPPPGRTTTVAWSSPPSAWMRTCATRRPRSVSTWASCPG